MKKIELVTVIVSATLFAGMGATSAEASAWSEAKICSAGVYTYFFLETQPALRSKTGEYLDFVSETNRKYQCRAVDGTINLKWVNDNGKSMSSSVTRYSISGDIVTVKTNLLTKTFASADIKVEELSSSITPKEQRIVPTPFPEEEARKQCFEAIKDRAANPSTVDIDVLFGYETKVSEYGNRSTYQTFSAANALGLVVKYQAECLFEPERLAEVYLREIP